MFSRITSSLLAASLLIPALAQAQTPPRYTISAVAGNGSVGFSGDAAAATSAQLSNPIAVAIDSSGNLYIADQVNHRIRKVDTSGTITTIAGKDTQGYDSEATVAATSSLYYPCGIAVDKSGNIYISDSVNHVVRKITGTAIATIAGNNTAGFTEFNTPTTANPDGDLLAKDASINLPTGIVVDAAGVVYFSDTNNHCIRKIATDGYITTIAGTGVAGVLGDGGLATAAKLNHPIGLALDSAGSLYIADQMNNRIRKINSAGIITTVAGAGLPGYSGTGGPATSAQLRYPSGVAVDASGNIFIADTSNSRIRVVLENKTIHNVAGNGRFDDYGDNDTALNAALRFPVSVSAGANGKVYVVDTQNHKIRLLTPVAVPPTSVDPPVISEGGVVTDTAFGAATAAAPGSWVEILGSNLASSTREWTAADFDGAVAPTVLEGTRVSVGDQPAYLSYVSPNRLKVQLPSSLSAGIQRVTVTTVAGSSAAYELTVNETEPGLQAPSTFRVDDMQFAAALLEDGATWALPEGAVEGQASRPVRSGETITLYGTGFGAVTPVASAGETVQGENALMRPLEILFGDTAAEVSYAGLAPGKVGIYQFKVVVPQLSEGGAVALTFRLDGVQGKQALFVPVQN
ncbi:MAG: hypothetical protein IPP47_04560 [Bryobacterales bacterium]|nr:hypothetical protein [Bryobacterales bacterium]